jgi:two-component system phosphate regulon sensor histidine kinase PhoR
LTGRIFFKLIFGVLCILIVALAAVDVLASRIAESSYIDTLTRELTQRAHTVALLSRDGFPHLKHETLRDLARVGAARLTVIAPDGRVLADSEADPAHMENHRTRPEVAAALEGREGSSIRQSPTVGVKFLYVAIPIPAGALRLAVPLSEIRSQVNAIRKRMLASTALAFLPAFFVAAFLARYVSSKLGAIIEYAGRLADGNFRARLDDPGSDELALLGRKLNDTGEKLQKMFEELEREHAELEKVERVRKDFVINVSHELRTPLASIQGYTETLLDGALHDSEHNVRFLSIIRQNAERLARLIADLLTLSRIELKTQKFQLASYYVNSLLTDCVDSIRPLAAKKGIAIALEPAPEGTEVFCDAEAFHQALSNLLDNALKYTPDGGTVSVSCRVLDPTFLEVRVRDTGPGISAEELPRLFERFYRVDKARSRELGGTGLGLAIVKHLARAHGGEVGVESEPGKGSTFFFTIPMQDLGLDGERDVQSELTVS